MKSDVKLDARCIQRQNTFDNYTFSLIHKIFRTKISFCRPALMANKYWSEFLLALRVK